MGTPEGLRERIEGRLSELGKPAAWLSRESGVNPSTISRWVNGHTNPDPMRFSAVARVLGVDPAWLLTGEPVLSGFKSFPARMDNAAPPDAPTDDVQTSGRDLATQMAQLQATLAQITDQYPELAHLTTKRHTDEAPAALDPGVAELLADTDLLAKRGISPEVQGALRTLRTGLVHTKQKALRIALELEYPDS